MSTASSMIGTSGRKMSGATTLASHAPPTDITSATSASGNNARQGMTTFCA